MKGQIKAPEKIELSDAKIATLSDDTVQNTSNQDATEMVECVCKIEGKVKAMKWEIKENV